MSYNFEKTDNGIFRLKLTANAKKIIADLRRPLEILMKGNTINHPDLTVSAVQLLLSHDGVLIQLVILKERLENLYCTRCTLASRAAAAARGYLQCGALFAQYKLAAIATWDGQHMILYISLE